MSSKWIGIVVFLVLLLFISGYPIKMNQIIPIINNIESLDKSSFLSSHILIDSCKNEQLEEEADPIIKEVAIEANLSQVDLTSTESLQKFCAPYTHTLLYHDNKEYHMCVWPLGEDTMISNNILLGSLWEVANINRMTEVLKGKPKGIVIDAGANIGEFTLIAAALGHVVFSFEPISEHVEMLKKSLLLNDFQSNVRLFLNGLGNRNEKSSITLKSGNRGGSSVKLKGKREIAEDVYLIKMDELFDMAKHDYPGLPLLFWKADIEGWEERMLNGAQKWYTHYLPEIMLFELMANGVAEKECNLESYLRGLLKMYKIALVRTDEKPGPELNEYTVSDFSASFPRKAGHVYDMWLTKKQNKPTNSLYKLSN